MKMLTAASLITAGTMTMNAQNVSISAPPGTSPNPAAMLHVDGTTGLSSGNQKGVLIPTVSLTDASVAAPIGPTPLPQSLVVFNTNASMTNGNGPGFYYWDGSKWVYLAAPANGPGSAGQVLTSQGPNNPPQWLSLSGSGGILQGSALGTAMMTAYMDSIGLFRPHGNNCDATTEAFVPLWSGASVGYCIEKDERPAAYWTDAIRTCLSLGKRLPEPWEWQVACDNATTLNIDKMINNWEWASNFALPMLYTGSNYGVDAAVFGNGGCNYAAWDWLGSNYGYRGSHAFRCVR